MTFRNRRLASVVSFSEFLSEQFLARFSAHQAARFQRQSKSENPTVQNILGRGDEVSDVGGSGLCGEETMLRDNLVVVSMP
jgi:hypothetical protein